MNNVILNKLQYNKQCDNFLLLSTVATIVEVLAVKIMHIYTYSSSLENVNM